MSNFDYAGPLNETVLLGNVALRTGQKINWDAKKMKVTNIRQANKYEALGYKTVPYYMKKPVLPET